MYVPHEFAHMYGSPCCYDHMQVMEYFFSAISTIIPPFLGLDSQIFIPIFSLFLITCLCTTARLSCALWLLR